MRLDLDLDKLRYANLCSGSGLTALRSEDYTKRDVNVNGRCLMSRTKNRNSINITYEADSH